MPKKRGRAVEGRGNTAKRTGSTAHRPARVSDDVELWTPPARTSKTVKAEMIDGAKRAASRGFASDVVVSRTLDVAPVAGELELFKGGVHVAGSQRMTNRELGFDAKGRCLYGCDGCRSIKSQYQNVAMHHYKCKFWETEDSRNITPF